MNDEIQSSNNNFQVRFTTFIFFYKEIYIYIYINIKNWLPGWGSGVLGGDNGSND